MPPRNSRTCGRTRLRGLFFAGWGENGARCQAEQRGRAYRMLERRRRMRRARFARTKLQVHGTESVVRHLCVMISTHASPFRMSATAPQDCRIELETDRNRGPGAAAGSKLSPIPNQPVLRPRNVKSKSPAPAGPNRAQASQLPLLALPAGARWMPPPDQASSCLAASPAPDLSARNRMCLATHPPTLEWFAQMGPKPPAAAGIQALWTWSARDFPPVHDDGLRASPTTKRMGACHVARKEPAP